MKKWNIIVLLGGLILTACQPKDTLTEKAEPGFLKIVCSRGPIYPANIEIHNNGDLIYSGEILDEKEVGYGEFEHYFKGKLSDAELAYLSQLVDTLASKVNEDRPIELGSSWYFMRIYYQNGYREYKGQQEKIWEELMGAYKKVNLEKVKGKRTFETMTFVLPPLPDVSNQPEIEEIKE
jgi:hypothetical protein